ncbi:MAG: glycosyl transferase family protein [Microgenomates group bacterium Gr01-1014_7]|nr:MAG: glycosyl transferase family protein [Microgenomates group bacterium Gr01-1014_7]
MISTVVINYNQSNKLEDCLKSVQNFADEILVVDLGSTDQSQQVAKKFNAIFIQHKFVPYVEIIRNFAVSKANGDWILVLDPDEQITDDLAKKLKDVTLEDKYAAVNIPRKNIFFGKWIAHTNWWPDRHVRFFKKGKVKWEDRIHFYPRVDGKVLDLPAREDLAIIHFGYQSIEQFIDRQSRYSTIKAQNLYESGVRFSWFSFFWNPFREFIVRYIRHAGFLDGFLGLSLTFLMMVYQLQVLIKLWELEQNK